MACRSSAACCSRPSAEYSQATVREALLGENRPYDAFEGDIPARPPVLCAGCPHRGLFYALKKLKVYVSGDIGCYTLGASAPLSCIDACVCMGASISGLHGYNTARGKESAKKSVAVIGDSTFCHSGITGWWISPTTRAFPPSLCWITPSPA